MYDDVYDMGMKEPIWNLNQLPTLIYFCISAAARGLLKLVISI